MIYTIYCCGTAYNRNCGDAVADLAKDTASEGQILDGPGGGEWMPNIFGGLADPKGLGYAGMLSGRLFGSGVDENIEQIMKSLHLLASVPETINMCGWSRGAVTCLKTANHLASDVKFKAVPVNIFGIDPVPGTSPVGNDWMWKDIGLASNIHRYFAVLALNERRLEMTPVVPSGSDRRIWVDTMPGVHSSMVEKVGDHGEPALIVKDFAYRFLRHFGTRFSSYQPLSRAQILELYADVKTHFKDFVKLGEDQGTFRFSVFGGSLDRPVKDDRGRAATTKQVPLNSKSTLLPELSGFFVNKHHREVFHSLYPVVTSEINGTTPRAFDSSRKHSWQPELDRMRRATPKTFRQLSKVYKIA
jgi:hypothetical protein